MPNLESIRNRTEDPNQELFNYMSNEHNVTLLESDMAEIRNIIDPPLYPYKLGERPSLISERNAAISLCRIAWLVGVLGWTLAIIFGMCFVAMLIKH